MATVLLTKATTCFSGRSGYEDGCIYSETDNPYDMDRWFVRIGQISIDCTADKQILKVYGYLPDMNWARKESLEIPCPSKDRNFILDANFDEDVRDAHEEGVLSVEFSRSQRALRILIVDASEHGAPKVFVSPHENFILGATHANPMVLTEFYLLNVVGVDHL